MHQMHVMAWATTESRCLFLIFVSRPHNQAIPDELKQPVNSNHCPRDYLLQEDVCRLPSLQNEDGAEGPIKARKFSVRKAY